MPLEREVRVLFQSKSYKSLKFFISSVSKRVLVFALALLGSLSLAAQNRFVHVPTYPAGGSLPTLLAQHDVNGDGKLDLIVMNVNTTTKLETVSLLLGTGTGGYLAPKSMAYYPMSYGKPLATDINRDGHLDLIFASGRPQITRVYLGQGESFQPTAIVSKGAALCDVYTSSCSLPEIQVADLNKDGNPDLLLESPESYTVWVFLGNGNGSFRTGVVAAGGGAITFTTGDFNNDGLLDLALVGGAYDEPSVTILPGNGNGTFREGPSYSLPNGIIQVGQLVAADLRGNGNTDLILVTALTAAQAAVLTAYQGSDACREGGVAVMLGNGDGTLAPASTYPTGDWTAVAVVTDMNGDHRPDLVVTNQSGGSYSVLLNAGSGKFSPAVNYRSPVSLAGDFVVGDLNGDGRPDLTIASKNGVEVLLNAGGGKLIAPQSVDLRKETTPFRTLSGDLNNDGLPDLVLLADWGDFGCHLYDKIGELDIMVTSQKGQPLSLYQDITRVFASMKHSDLGLGDLNHYGGLDVLALGTDFWGATPSLDNLLPHGTSFFLDDQYQYSGLTVGDFNRDGYADAALTTYGDGMLIELGDGTGSFNPAYADPGISSPLVSRDVNGDGKLDLLETAEDGIHILFGNGDGTFKAPKVFPSGGLGNLTIADFNRDGKLDLAVAGGSEVALILNSGNGTFKSPVKYPAGGPVDAIAAISLLGNGNQSILVADSKDNKLLLLAGDGKGNLAAPVNYYPGGGNPSSLIVSDFNGDGASDVVVTDTVTSSFMVLYNTGGTSIKLTSSNVKPLAGQTVVLTATLGASIAGTGTPTGTVTFKNGSTTLGTINLSAGKAVLNTASLARGAHTLTAVYNGSTTFNSHVSAGLTVTVQ
jgi:Bacterial Ig-like domain (group 3)/FG-GAP-like repeat